MTKSADVPDVNNALAMNRAARTIVLRVFKREFPDLYTLSADAFEHPLGSVSHEVRVRELLTEWDDALAKSPLERQAEGRVDAVGQVLAPRAVRD